MSMFAGVILIVLGLFMAEHSAGAFYRAVIKIDYRHTYRIGVALSLYAVLFLVSAFIVVYVLHQALN